jgi:hypothetical protein
MTEEFIKLPIQTGRVHDDRLGVGERAVVDYLAELPVDRIQAVIQELADIARLRVEIEILQFEGLE